MSEERYAEHTVAWELPNRDSVTKGNYNLADIETKYLPIQTEVVSDNKDQTINKLQQRIAELEEQLKNAIVPKFKIGQKVFVIIETTKKDYIMRITTIDSITIFEGNNLSYYCKYIDGERMYLEFDENEMFATKEEAELKLKELKGENK